MALFEDDDELGSGPFRDGRQNRRSNHQDDSWDDEPDERDLVPDEMATVHCTRCRKWILEDSIRCPYCHEIQIDGPRNRKPLWFVVTAICCIFLTVGYLLLETVLMLGIFHR